MGKGKFFEIIFSRLFLARFKKIPQTPLKILSTTNLQEQFHRIAEELSLSQPLNKRQEALLRLCQVPTSDVMASESWHHLRIALMDALADDDTFISHTALSFHAKMFAGENKLKLFH